MSLCNVCTKPGACCHNFSLTFKDGTVRLPVALANAKMKRHNYPFIAIGRNEDGFTRFSCPLLKDGRCSDYENRPQTCRNFEPAGDDLCVFFEKIRQGNAAFDGEGIA